MEPSAWTFAGIERTPCRALSRGRLFTAHASTGAALPLLFVHGGFHGAWCWARFMTFFADRGMPSAALDLRGHGGLPQDADFALQGFDAMAEDVAEALALLARPAILVGHSLGALLALKAAEGNAQIAGLALLAPAVPAGVASGPQLPRFPDGTPTPRPAAPRARKWFLSGLGADVGIAPYLGRLCAESPAFLNACLHDRIAVDPSLISVPVCVLSGARDDTALHRGDQDAAVAAYLGAVRTVIPRAGHCLMLDDAWRDAAQALAAWVAGIVPP